MGERLGLSLREEHSLRMYESRVLRRGEGRGSGGRLEKNA
jgi:hypothetical protein